MSLKDLMITEIARTGPMRLDRYMHLALSHPKHGYYMQHDPLGTQGDFTTAPEISQMFGELIGLSLAQNWLDQGSPSPIALVELGPGRGTLMADILRATKTVPGFHAALEVHLVETSPHLQSLQAVSLAGFAPTWHADITSLPKRPIWLVANEFFDALPIRQFLRKDQGWCERQIGAHDGQLHWGLSAPLPLAQLAHRLEDTRDGDLVETCAPAQAIFTDLSQHVAHQGGAMLVIDYGDWRSLGDTLQALKSHKAHPPLDAPGTADLTAHVDFEALTSQAQGTLSRLTPQNLFLSRLGISQRAERLAQALSGPALSQHEAAFHRLTAPEEMGTLFKIIGCVCDGAPMLPGLTT